MATKIFIVDDNPLQLEMIQDHFKGKQHLNINSISTGEECLQRLNENPEIVVLDYQLDNVNREAANGLEILKAIKSRNQDIEVVMLSGQERIEVAVNSMRDGAFDYVIKNESAFLRLEYTINKILDRKAILKNRDALKKIVVFLGILVAILIVCLIGILFIWDLPMRQ
jgi:two-component system OmpR family response regulator